MIQILIRFEKFPATDAENQKISQPPPPIASELIGSRRRGTKKIENFQAPPPRNTSAYTSNHEYYLFKVMLFMDLSVINVLHLFYRFFSYFKMKNMVTIMRINLFSSTVLKLMQSILFIFPIILVRILYHFFLYN
jgi:hypothetical protein